MSWTGKPCVGCDGRKGPNYRTRKYCGKCAVSVRKAAKEVAHERAMGIRYGLAPGAYERLHVAQGGLCALCRRATGRTRRLSVDHDHRTGEVRGLLCRPCNDTLGHARDSADYFARALSYLANPPARDVLGPQGRLSNISTGEPALVPVAHVKQTDRETGRGGALRRSRPSPTANPSEIRRGAQ